MIVIASLAMVLTSPANEARLLDEAARATLLDLARLSIEHGVAAAEPLRPVLSDYPAKLIADGASFVTLHVAKSLRGCIGSLQASRPLVVDVAEHAWAAAFQDPRFAPVRADEVSELEIHVSVLSEPVPMEVESEEDLLTQLRPGVDGLVLEESGRRATFLPAVWDDLQDPHVFLSQLRCKASLPLDYWSDSLRFYRYTTETFPD